MTTQTQTLPSLHTRTHMQALPITPITDEQLQDWISDTVGWRAIEISAGALMAAGAHHTQAKALVQAALEAGSRMDTRRCVISQVGFEHHLQTSPMHRGQSPSHPRDLESTAHTRHARML